MTARRSLGTLALRPRTSPLRLTQGRRGRRPSPVSGESRRWSLSWREGRRGQSPEGPSLRPAPLHRGGVWGSRRRVHARSELEEAGSQAPRATLSTPAPLWRQRDLGPPSCPGSAPAPPAVLQALGCSLGLPRGAGSALTCL